MIHGSSSSTHIIWVLIISMNHLFFCCALYVKLTYVETWKQFLVTKYHVLYSLWQYSDLTTSSWIPHQLDQSRKPRLATWWWLSHITSLLDGRNLSMWWTLEKQQELASSICSQQNFGIMVTCYAWQQLIPSQCLLFSYLVMLTRSLCLFDIISVRRVNVWKFGRMK
jgi:hypothetical protein